MRRRTAPSARDRPPSGAVHPQVNSLVTLVAATGRARPTRVEDVTAQWVAVVPPSGAGSGTVEELAAPGDPFELQWSCERGLLVLPVVLLERVPAGTDGGVPQWRLEPTGTAQLHQRRSFVRAAVASDWPVRVALTWLLPDEGTAEGELLDLGEGGLRASLRGWEGAEGTSVVVRLTVAEGQDAAPGTGVAGVAVTEFELLGTAVRARGPQLPAGAAATSPGATEVVVQLHDPGPASGSTADDLRALVFAWERRARRS